MGKLYRLSAYLPHKNMELICLNCKERFVGQVLNHIWLKQIICPVCKVQGYVIATGDFMTDEEYDKWEEENE